MTQGELREIVNYCPETGAFTWRKRISRKSVPGKAIGTSHSGGYLMMAIQKKRYFLHRLAWLYVHGESPDYIDHINSVRNDNRISNLRAASASQNCAYCKPKKKRGLKGAYKKSYTRKWMAQIRLNYKQIYLGYYDTELEAHRAYMEAAKQLFGEFARAA